MAAGRLGLLMTAIVIVSVCGPVTVVNLMIVLLLHRQNMTLLALGRR